ncbi:hypothetical protein CIL06_07165 [Pantoea vagans]|nr:hypothetical protein CIL06_07165 [Pantoea vagans]
MTWQPENKNGAKAPFLLLTNRDNQESYNNRKVKREGNRVRRGKRPAAWDKNAGSVFEQRNALARSRAHLRDEVRNCADRAARDWP